MYGIDLEKYGPLSVINTKTYPENLTLPKNITIHPEPQE